MNDQTDLAMAWPAAPAELGTDVPLLHASITVLGMNGCTIQSPFKAKLVSIDFSMKQISLIYQEENYRLSFSEIRSLLFEQSLLPPESGDLDQEPRKTLHLVFRDGQRYTGPILRALDEESCLHVFHIRDDKVFRGFIPRSVIRDFSLVDNNPNKGSSIDSQEIITLPDQLISALDFGLQQPGKPLGALLLEAGRLTNDELRNALLLQTQEDETGQLHRRLGEILLDKKMVDSVPVHQALAANLGLPFVSLKHFPISTSATGLLDESFVSEHHLIPIMHHNERLIIAMADPTDHETQQTLKFILGKMIEVAVATPEDITRSIGRFYSALNDEEMIDELESADDEDANGDFDPVLGTDRPTVRLVNGIISDAVRRRASDIHIFPMPNEIELFFRIDGQMVPIRKLSKRLLPSLVSRIKILGRLNIAEHRLPQDGNTRVRRHGKLVDLRTSVIPTSQGESVVIRVLDTQAGFKPLNEIGFRQDDLESIVDMIHQNSGIILVTGPTGSGKSTTLYAAIDQIKEQELNIITAEDPVEYQVAGVRQIQVNSKINYNFATALRHILRHDPDVIMIGEIRDKETAKMAVQSSLTGHLVLTTLHTNSAASAITRLLEIGIEPYLLNDSLLGVVAQRLVRVNCPHCLAVEQVSPAVRKTFDLSEDETFYIGRGCDECDQLGFRGRMAVYELLKIDSAIKGMVLKGASTYDIEGYALGKGMMALTQSALALAREKKISLSEVYRVRLN
ncbi:GspE/PulE family protein [Pelagibaculum spongiae]|nr:GspE/PulE family protein [Pelagibaculum spongiae]